MSDSFGQYRFGLSGWELLVFFRVWGGGPTHLVHVKDEVQLTDVLKALIQRLHEHLK